MRILPAIPFVAATLAFGCAAAPEDSDDEPPLNRPPIAHAGDDRTVLTMSRVVLDGSASTDPDGDALTYQWRIVTVPTASAASLEGPTTMAPSLVVDTPGTYEVSLVVHDGVAPSAADVMRIAVTGGAPVANAGADQSVHWGTTVHLDGRASVDPQADPLVHTWTLTARPPGSSAALVDPTTATPTFVADRVGNYEVRLVVSDGGAQSTDLVTIAATNGLPVARAGADQLAPVGQVVTLDGGASSDPDGDPLSFAWTVTTQPAGSTASPATPAQASTTFSPLLAGAYVLTLTVGDGQATATDTVALTVHAGGGVIVMTHDVVDAEYSNALDKVIAVSSAPAAVQIIDPTSGATVAVPLPLAGSSVSIAPGGLEAVVGHNGWLSVIDLATGVRTATYPTTTDAIDVIHGGNGWAYAMPRTGQWQNIRCVRLDTGAEQLGTGSIYAGAVARRHPTRTALYSADRGLSPADIELHDLTNGRSTYLRDSPYHGDYSMCGDLWFSDDGARIFTACGNVFRASTDAATDMTYNGSLTGMPLVGFLDHSAQAHRVAVVPRNGFMTPDADRRLLLFEDQFLAAAGSVDLPSITVDAALVPIRGRFVFWRSDGSRFYVLGRATPTTGAVRETLWSGTPPT